MAEEAINPLTRLQRLLHALALTEERECDCEAVFHVLDQMAELAAAGVDVSALMPDVQRHLHLCSCCQEEWKLLQAIVASNTSAPSI